MAKLVNLDCADAHKRFQDQLFRSIQSSHLNFLFGAGASCPGVVVAGNVENEILQLTHDDKGDEADTKTLQFLRELSVPMRELIADTLTSDVQASLAQYVMFLKTVDGILSERRTTLLPKQANLFTTNYDLFIEKASESCASLILNDGFNRAPSLKHVYKLSPERLFDVTHHTGNNYGYMAELPTINLIKIHGSMTWRAQNNDIVYDVMDFEKLMSVDERTPAAVRSCLEDRAIILPTQRKFKKTIMDRVYYDLLRIFANTLEREASLFISFGFSFRDEHILEIIKRALRNPTLNVIVCCYTADEALSHQDRFASYNNVSIVSPPSGESLNFDQFIQLISIIPGKAAI